jgi:hypothetical protein
MSRRTRPAKENLALEEIKFLQNPNALKKHATKALKKAKEVEAARIASGAVWKRDQATKSVRLTFN